jgi:chorismate synthase
VKIQIQGRHDPCALPRVLPVVEAMAALVLADACLLAKSKERIV